MKMNYNKTMREMILYEIWPKSFNDTTGNGMGDINGITEKLPYLKDLGITHIWLAPIFTSPMVDSGYDMADYKDVNPLFGTMEDFDHMVEKANELEIGILLDIAVNHSSSEHWWFKKALEGDKKYMDYYIFKDAKEDGSLPTNWESRLGGPTWEYVEKLDKYYFHIYAPEQPDLNWQNAELRLALVDAFVFWAKKGIAGFRLDVINHIAKDVWEDAPGGRGADFYTNRPKVHEYVKYITKKVKEVNKDIIMIGQLKWTPPEELTKYTNPSNEELTGGLDFAQVQTIDHDFWKWDFKEKDFSNYYNVIKEYQEYLQHSGGSMVMGWNCHDLPRAVTRFLDDREYLFESATVLFGTLISMMGPVLINYGDEYGQVSPKYERLEQYRDIESINFYNDDIRKTNDHNISINKLMTMSRDNARAPFLWNSNSEDNYGFTNGLQPWIDFHERSSDINLESDINRGEKSIHNFYKKAISFKKESETLKNGNIEFINFDDGLFTIKRWTENQEFIIMANLSENSKIQSNIDLSNYKKVFGNYKSEASSKINKFEFVVFEKDN